MPYKYAQERDKPLQNGEHTVVGGAREDDPERFIQLIVFPVGFQSVKIVVEAWSNSHSVREDTKEREKQTGKTDDVECRLAQPRHRV